MSRARQLADSADLSFDDGTLVVDSANNRVGIGTASPAFGFEYANTDPILQIKDSNSTGSAANPYVRMVDSNGDFMGALGFASAATSDLYLWQASANPITFITNASEAMRIDSSGNVGIGTSSPNSYGNQTVLTINGTDYGRLDLEASGALKGSVFGGGDGLYLDAGINQVLMFAGGSERMRIDSSGNVGIGTGTPTTPNGLNADNPLNGLVQTIYGTSPAINLISDTSGSGYSLINFGRTGFTSNPYRSSIGYDQANDEFVLASYNQIVFKNDNLNGTERMRIDSSGRVLVGATSFQYNTQGVGLRGDTDYSYFTSSGSAPLLVNRKTNDGDVIRVFRETIQAGSIGARTASSAPRLTIGDGDVGLWFRDDLNSILPNNHDTNANNDAAIDIGNSSNRFKDLYLSGGVYLGGTGAANKLDDYEEGTWTPAFGSVGGATGTTLVQGAYYRKVGNLVVATCDITLTTKGTLNGGDLAMVHGLPFNAVSGSGVGGGSVDLFLDLNQNVNTLSFTSQGDDKMLFRVTTSETSSASNATWTNLFKNSTRMFLTMTYLTP